ncbi:asparagine synthase (glutamine-hydrolyzing) [Paenibacillus swuensis]|uniref:asparagine synthase (glutamine-hydrolyzing) n=1 Tax=Paenibacillus swuensis TaxID=1178515 RepID=UPI000838B0CE|nr:asparagine synthase (glutamine-hydrolyzing) [Paenibacillus swuensis]
MSGIHGVYYFDENEVTSDLLSQMASPVLRGGQAIHAAGKMEGPLGLGICWDDRSGPERMEAENEAGNVTIVFDGALYNARTLRDQLVRQGHKFKENTDAETTVHLYEQYGEDCVKHLRGKFAFMIWDAGKEQLFGARDHFGIKSLYYYRDYHQFLFASGLKSLLAVPGMRKSVAQESLYAYLSLGYVPEGDTMLEGFRKVPAAHTITVSITGHAVLKRYWDPMFEPQQRTEMDYVGELRMKLKETVKAHVERGEAAGSLLSGGLDSAAITALVPSKRPLPTFTATFDALQDRSVYAAKTAEKLGTHHHTIPITEEQLFAAMPQVVWHLDEPVADPQAAVLYLLAGVTGQHVSTALSGEGADELFGGHAVYREAKLLRPMSLVPRGLLKGMNKLISLLPEAMTGRAMLLKAASPLEERYAGGEMLLSEELKASLLQMDRRALHSYPNPYDIAAPAYERSEHLDAVTRMQYADISLRLPGSRLMAAEKLSAAQGLDLRFPFLDRKLFETVKKIPASYRLQGKEHKSILRKAMQGIVPDSVLHRTKPALSPLLIPLREWIKGERGERMIEFIEQSGVARYFDTNMLWNVYLKHRRGSQDYTGLLWALYTFAMWHMLFVEDVHEQEDSGILTSEDRYGKLWNRDQEPDSDTEEKYA